MSDRRPSLDQIEATAFDWVQREHAGLSPVERAQLDAWLSADMRHFEKFDELKTTWSRFEDFGNDLVISEPKPDLARFAPPAAPARRSILLRFAPYLAAAAVLTLSFILWNQRSLEPVAQSPIVYPAPLEQRTLEDGSIVELNRGAQISVAFTSAERHIQLLSGEANFTVAKNANRPFIVQAGAVSVRAVGTAFNVRYDPTSVEVVVTEGKVQVATPTDTVPLLEAGHSTKVSLAQPSVPQVAKLTDEELESKTLWQPKLLDFDDEPLSVIVSEFNRRNSVQFVIEQNALRSRRMSGSFRSDNIEGFVRLLETHFNVRAEYRSDREIILSRP